jgi:superfamily I DNA and/or RNA helicase
VRRLDKKLTKALPLWIGSLPDIDDLLPAVTALFDIVILDEASSIDQTLAVPALLRAERAVVVGDPHQLRHVSFLSDDQISSAVAAHDLDRTPLIAARVDVRRNSIFDVATGVASVLTLAEHFRSNPHLVNWVARRLYGRELQVATRSPVTDAKDCIEVKHTAASRDKKGVVAAEVHAIIVDLKELQKVGARSVGVITPFRAQADAIEVAVLAAIGAAEPDAAGSRGDHHRSQPRADLRRAVGLRRSGRLARHGRPATPRPTDLQSVTA